MTTAHRPTFDPARGKEAQRGVAYHQRLMPAHTQLKIRKAGQGGAADPQNVDLRAQLLQAEAVHYEKNPSLAGAQNSKKRLLEDTKPGADKTADGEDDEVYEARKKRVLEETRAIDAASDNEDEPTKDKDDDGDDSDEDSSDEDDEEDETAELMRELAKIKQERAQKKEEEEREKASQAQEQRESDIAYGNPLLQPDTEAGNATDSQRRWDDDVVFRNQARGTEKRGKAEFVNDLLRSDFHKRFMTKYVR